jgi:hypothetical protein
MLTQHSVQYNLYVTVIKKTRWQGKDIIDKKTQFRFKLEKKGERTSMELDVLLRRRRRRSNVIVKSVTERMCLLKIKTKLSTNL